MKKYSTPCYILWIVATHCFLTHAMVMSGSVITAYPFRPQSVNSARKVSGEVPGTRLVDVDSDCYYKYVGAAPEYTETFNTAIISEALFGSWLQPQTINPGCHDGCKKALVIQGTAVPDRNPNALRAEDFYLGEDFSGIMSFSPEISNFLVDFQWYISFDPAWHGGYLRLYAPFVHTQWDLNACEVIKHKGTTVINGSFTGATIDEQQLLPSATAYFGGATPPLLSFSANPNLMTTTTRDPLAFTKICAKTCNSTRSCNVPCTRKHDNAFAELRAELGWNFLQCEDRHCGFNLQFAAPTGTQKQAETLFQPIVGNGAHWELGAGCTGHIVFWESCWNTYHAGIYFDAMVTHLFASTQERTFDLKNAPLSRYMLAALHDKPYAGTLTGSSTNTNPLDNTTAAQYQFANVYSPVANLTTQKVRVSVGVQADISIWLNYSAHNFSCDFGYNFYARSCESIDCSCCPSRLGTEPTWALKGDAHAYGFVPSDYSEVSLQNTPYALSFSENSATPSNPAANNNQNANINGAQYAVVTPLTNPVTFVMSQPGIAAATTASIIRTSIQPTFLTPNDIDYKPQARLITNKFFAHFSRQWEGRYWNPFMGCGGEVEFGVNAQKNCPSEKNCCRNVGVSQWGLWFKTGIAFD